MILVERVYKGMDTPWGVADNVEPIVPGIGWAFTPSHGGILLSRDWNKRIPADYRRKDGWYEEDCDALIPAYFLHEVIGHTFRITRDEIFKQMQFWHNR